jgi:hypothetical protein
VQILGAQQDGGVSDFGSHLVESGEGRGNHDIHIGCIRDQGFERFDEINRFSPVFVHFPVAGNQGTAVLHDISLSVGLPRKKAAMAPGGAPLPVRH